MFIILVLLGLGLLYILVALLRNSLPAKTDSKWSAPVPMTDPQSLFRWNGAAVIMDRDGAFRILDENGQWIEKRASGFEIEQSEGCGPVLATADSATAIFFDMRFANKVQAISSLIRGSLTTDRNLQMGPRMLLQNYIQDPFAEVPLGPGVKRDVAMVCGEGVIHRGDLYVPYLVQS